MVYAPGNRVKWFTIDIGCFWWFKKRVLACLWVFDRWEYVRIFINSRLWEYVWIFINTWQQKIVNKIEQKCSRFWRFSLYRSASFSKFYLFEMISSVRSMLIFMKSRMFNIGCLELSKVIEIISCALNTSTRRDRTLATTLLLPLICFISFVSNVGKVLCLGYVPF